MKNIGVFQIIIAVALLCSLTVTHSGHGIRLQQPFLFSNSRKDYISPQKPDTDSGRLVSRVDTLIQLSRPLKVLLVVEPSPFSYVSGYTNRFEEMLTNMREAGDEGM